MGAFIYIAASLSLFIFFKDHLSPDTTSYIEIAKHYHGGLWQEAINAYWGPLYSWLLSLLLHLPVDPLYSTKILSLCIGLALYITSISFASLFSIPKHFFKWVHIGAFIFSLNIGFLLNTPDGLLALLAMWFYFFLFAPKGRLVSRSLALGSLTALLYYTKAYGLPLGIFSLCLWTLYRYLTQQSAGLWVRITLLSTLVALVLIAPWVTALSQKYGKVFLTSTPYYSRYIVHPSINRNDPMFTDGLFELPHPQALSIWEDPTYFNLKDWSPFQSVELFRHQWVLIFKNLNKVFQTYQYFSAFSIFIFLALAYHSYKRQNSNLSEESIRALIILIATSAGYLLILVVRRYIFVHQFVLFYAGISLLSHWFSQSSKTPKFQRNVLILFLVSFLWNPIHKMYKQSGGGAEVRRLSHWFEDQNIKGVFASDSQWRKTLFISSRTGNQYLGQIEPGRTIDTQFELEAKSIGADFLLIWNPESSVDNLTLDLVAEEPISGLKVYQFY